MHPPTFFASWLLLAGIAVGVSSCSTAKKRDAEADGEDRGLLGRISINGVTESIEEDTYDELKEIANSPTSHLPGLDQDNESGLASDEDTPGPLAQAPVDPVTAWKREGVEPRRISIGDIFSENSGPILNKQLSIADELPDEERTSLLERISREKDTRVPMTLSQSEIAALREEANPAEPFPTRSVALDFRTKTLSADVSKLEKLFASAEKGELSVSKDKISQVKKRLGEGERLFTIVGVTESEKMKATYPGAPVGSRDAEPIRNAVEILYPHLDSLEAEKKDDAVEITREHGIVWEFEARELKLEDGEIVIDEEPASNL